MITGLGYDTNKLQNTTNIVKIARNSPNSPSNPIISKVRQKQTIVIGNLKEHKTLLSSIFLFGDLV